MEYLVFYGAPHVRMVLGSLGLFHNHGSFTIWVKSSSPPGLLRLFLGFVMKGSRSDKKIVCVVAFPGTRRHREGIAGYINAFRCERVAETLFIFAFPGL